ncbi:hypothetical protein K1719_043166 [Acacia pycnantha]|nr:hypothetical protein K1719_043166 [Acacia pycnantha]
MVVVSESESSSWDEERDRDDDSEQGSSESKAEEKVNEAGDGVKAKLYKQLRRKHRTHVVPEAKADFNQSTLEEYDMRLIRVAAKQVPTSANEGKQTPHFNREAERVPTVPSIQEPSFGDRYGDMAQVFGKIVEEKVLPLKTTINEVKEKEYAAFKASQKAFDAPPTQAENANTSPHNESPIISNPCDPDGRGEGFIGHDSHYGSPLSSPYSPKTNDQHEEESNAPKEASHHHVSIEPSPEEPSKAHVADEEQKKYAPSCSESAKSFHFRENNKGPVSVVSKLKPHLEFLVLFLISLYTFFAEGSTKGKPDTWSVVSSVAFTLTYLCFSRQIELGFDDRLFTFFLAFVITQLMEIHLSFILVAAVLCNLLVFLGSYSELQRENGDSSAEESVVIRIDDANRMTACFRYPLLIFWFYFEKWLWRPIVATTEQFLWDLQERERQQLELQRQQLEQWEEQWELTGEEQWEQLQLQGEQRREWQQLQERLQLEQLQRWLRRARRAAVVAAGAAAAGSGGSSSRSSSSKSSRSSRSSSSG